MHSITANGYGDLAVFENRQPVTAAKFITKSSLSILLLGVIRRLELKLNSEQKVENKFVARHIAKPDGFSGYTNYNDVLRPILSLK